MSGHVAWMVVIPLAGAVLAAAVGPRIARWVAVAVSLGTLVEAWTVARTVAAAPLGAGHQLLEYPPGAAGALIAAVEAALTASIALVLLMFFPSTDGGART